MQENLKEKKLTIAVGISGGVDSSVAAYLLKKEGHTVIGIFVKTWSPDWLPCTWVDEKRDAMRVCAALDIPFYFLDAEEEYKKGVADYMIAEYRAGRTPNPDVLCNRIIKFGALWQYAQTLGATAIATGHYAQTDGVHLMKGIDASKDQSYFLWMLEKEELAHIRFPIGSLPKKDVRKIAEDAGLFTATKKDSQGICFLGDVDMTEFLSHYVEQKKGAVKDVDGNVVGEHDGVWFFAIGTRHGFRITTKGADQTPYYVVGKDIEQNILVVSTNPKSQQTVGGVQTVTVRSANWLQDIDTKAPSVTYTAQIRYHGALYPAQIIDTSTVCITCDEILPLGQSIVIYEGDTVIGAGIIDYLS